MKDPKIHFFNRIACLCTALRIERKLRLEQRLRKKAPKLGGAACKTASLSDGGAEPAHQGAGDPLPAALGRFLPAGICWRSDDLHRL